MITVADSSTEISEKIMTNRLLISDAAQAYKTAKYISREK